MSEFWKTTAMILMAVILSTSIEKTEKDISVVLNIVACCISALVALKYLSPVVSFLWKINTAAGSAQLYMGQLLKIAGIALMTEFAGMISSDAGDSSLKKAMHILGCSAMLYTSLPLLEGFFTIIQEILRML